MRRVSVVGTLGCGKSTFARALAARLNVPYYYSSGNARRSTAST